MVCAVVSARVSPAFLEKINSVRLMPCIAKSLDANIVADFVCRACISLPGTIISEPGDFYSLEVWRVKSILGRDFKYPETLAERMAIELAHYISLAGRRLIIEARSNNDCEGWQDCSFASERESK